MRRIPRTAASLAPALLLACAHARTPDQQAMMKRGDCGELLKAADAARAASQPELAADLASACTPDKLAELVDRSAPEQGLLWCGRAAAAGQKGCEQPRIAELAAQLNPHLTLGPSDESTPLDPLLGLALGQVGKDLNLSWSAQDPDVIVGRLSVVIDHSTTATTATASDLKGRKVRVPATQHRFVAKVEAQVALGSKTRTLRAQEEARDNTWEAAPRLAVAARFEPYVPAPDELKKRATVAWLRTLAKALAANPPEGVQVNDAKGCVAYGLSLNLNSGDPAAAAQGAGEPARIAACEQLLGEPAGAGIPVP
jgi:hypothetical protein